MEVSTFLGAIALSDTTNACLFLEISEVAELYWFNFSKLNRSFTYEFFGPAAPFVSLLELNEVT